MNLTTINQKGKIILSHDLIMKVSRKLFEKLSSFHVKSFELDSNSSQNNLHFFITLTNDNKKNYIKRLKDLDRSFCYMINSDLNVANIYTTIVIE